MKKDNIVPFISKKITRLSPAGNILEEKEVVVQGESLKKCKELFDKIWSS